LEVNPIANFVQCILNDTDLFRGEIQPNMRSGTNSYKTALPLLKYMFFDGYLLALGRRPIPQYPNLAIRSLCGISLY
jgi:hypothetical protein